MLGSRLLLLIQAHAGPLTHDAVKDVLTNERTPTFRRLNPADVEMRVSALYYNLAKWIGDPDESAVRLEYEEMGRIRFREGVPVSELVYALLITKQHLRGYIREHGLLDFAGDRVVPEDLLGLELHSIQELNYQKGEFFDRALYHLAYGYEAEARSGLCRLIGPPGDVRIGYSMLKLPTAFRQKSSWVHCSSAVKYASRSAS